MRERKRIAIIGGGPAGLVAADALAPHHEVHVYEQGRSVGRKFLVAGQGGFNLTNSADGPALAAMYSPAGFLDEALGAFGSNAFREWLSELGIETYVGTSGRVFPTKGTKPVEVLNAMRARLLERGVHFHLEHTFVGFDEHTNAIIEHDGQRSSLTADFTIFSLGGASWSVTGSTGKWSEHFAQLGIEVTPFLSSNCGVEVEWPGSFARDHAGKPLKNIAVSAGERSVIGEATITQHGLEGNAIYPVVPALRDAIANGTGALLYLDLKPNNTTDQLLQKIAGKEPKNYAAALNLDRATMALLKAFTTKERFHSPFAFVQDVKGLQLTVNALRPIEEAISTVGGIPTTELAPDFSLKRYPRLFTVGEMVDWDAPTGGFLLQGCYSMGWYAAHAILER
ncbi:MAG: TIGR03862 family flavoprotein [Flavobacteriales bacterium]|nr:TIGR03862 family flavoprotein [Flavobacteriales bacterium]